MGSSFGSTQQESLVNYLFFVAFFAVVVIASILIFTQRQSVKKRGANILKEKIIIQPLERFRFKSRFLKQLDIQIHNQMDNAAVQQDIQDKILLLDIGLNTGTAVVDGTRKVPLMGNFSISTSQSTKHKAAFSKFKHFEDIEQLFESLGASDEAEEYKKYFYKIIYGAQQAKQNFELSDRMDTLRELLVVQLEQAILETQKQELLIQQ